LRQKLRTIFRISIDGVVCAIAAVEVTHHHPIFVEFKTTTGKEARIDYVYCTQPLFDIIQYADVITDEYTKPVRDPKELSNFWWPSDHRPPEGAVALVTLPGESQAHEYRAGSYQIVK